MSSKFKWKWERSVWPNAVLNTDSMKRLVEKEAEKIRNRCGEGYAVSSKKGRKRALAKVYAKTPEAMRDNSENNTLLKAVR